MKASFPHCMHAMMQTEDVAVQLTLKKVKDFLQLNTLEVTTLWKTNKKRS